MTPDPATVKAGKTLQFTATGTSVGGLTQDLTKSSNLTWSSSNTKVETIANRPTRKKGLASGVSAGTVTISAKMKGFATPGTATLTVN